MFGLIGRRLARQRARVPRTSQVVVLAAMSALCSTALPARAAELDWVQGFKETEPMLEARAGAAGVIAGEFLYMIGGVDGHQFLATVETARIKPAGLLEPWKAARPLPDPRGFMAAVAHNGAIYVAGGGAGLHGETLYRSVLRAQVNADGSLGQWEAEAEMRLPRRCVKLFVHKNRLYAVGGFGGALLDSVEHAEIQPNGKLGDWILEPALLTRARYVSESRVVGDVAITLGGHESNGGRGLASTEITRLGGNSLAWTAAEPMNVGRYAFGSFASGSDLYVLGGISGTDYLASIERRGASDRGDLAKWNILDTILPESVAEFATLTKDKAIFILGGTSPGGYRRGVWTAELDGAGGIGFRGRAVERANKSVSNADGAAPLPNEGVVRQTMDASGYTYILVGSGGGESWLAVPVTPVTVDARIRYGQGVFMSGFYSKTLKRTFPAITFVGRVEIVQ